MMRRQSEKKKKPQNVVSSSGCSFPEDRNGRNPNSSRETPGVAFLSEETEAEDSHLFLSFSEVDIFRGSGEHYRFLLGEDRLFLRQDRRKNIDQDRSLGKEIRK